MATVKLTQSLAIETAALAKGWTEEQLLDLAGNNLGHAVARHFPHPATVIGYLGKGHNAGDALVALRVLRDDYGWEIQLRFAFPAEAIAPLTRKKWEELGSPEPLDTPPQGRSRHGLLLIDGLLGCGTSGPLRTPITTLAAEMKDLRDTHGAKIAAVDLPTGIDPDSGLPFVGGVTADVTFMIGSAKAGLLRAEAVDRVGALAVVPVAPLTAYGSSGLEVISPQTCAFGKTPRSFDFHKGQAGRVSLVVGSRAYSGAAVLAAIGALRGGAGLVTLFVPESAHNIIISKCPPEVMVRAYKNFQEILDDRFDALVIGCGLGKLDAAATDGLVHLIQHTHVPVVVDADALNAVSTHRSPTVFRTNHLLTPHPGEFAALAPHLSGLAREEAARCFTDECSATLLLKGSRTVIAQRGSAMMCNSTGNPGMATGGNGDLLAGLIGAKLGSGLPVFESACLGAWICGRASEIALTENSSSEESLLPSDSARFIGAAFCDWKGGLR